MAGQTRACRTAQHESLWLGESAPPVDKVLVVTVRPDAQVAAVLGAVHNLLRRVTPPPQMLGPLGAKPGSHVCQLLPEDLARAVADATDRYQPDLFLVVDPAGIREKGIVRIAEAVVLVGLDPQVPVLAVSLSGTPGRQDSLRWLVPPRPGLYLPWTWESTLERRCDMRGHQSGRLGSYPSIRDRERHTFLQAIAEQTRTLVAGDASALCLLDPSARVIRLVAGSGPLAGRVGDNAPARQWFSGQVLSSNRGRRARPAIIPAARLYHHPRSIVM